MLAAIMKKNMKRILSLIPLAAVLALMAPVAAYAAATPTPQPKGPPPGKPVVQPHPQVVHTPIVTHTPPPKPIIHQPIVKPGPQPTPPPKGTPPAFYKKPVVNQNAPVNKPGPTPTFTKGVNTHKPLAGNPGGNAPIVNNNIHIKQNKNWAGPQAHGGGGGGGQFTQANNYGGHWVAGNIHPDWSHGGEHVWNGHHWRWFNGGWLIVDGGFWPAGYYNYYSGPSKMYDAQAELANMGYYDGAVDGVAGPETRQAIANYQTDYGLPVDGHLNPPTQESLGLVPPPPQD